MITFFQTKRPLNIRKLLIVFLIIFSTLLLARSIRSSNDPIGESDDYMITAISMQNHWSLDIRPQDLERARLDYPTHYEHMQRQYDLGGYLTAKDGKIYPYYMATYSLACIPMKVLLASLGLDQAYAFPVTNAIVYIISFWVLFLKLNVCDKSKFSLLLLLASMPTMLYFFWPSAEMFMAAMMIMSLVFWVNRNYKLAAFFVSLVGSLNLTCMVLGMVILADYFLHLYENTKTDDSMTFAKKLTCTIKCNVVDIFKQAMCFVPCLITPIFNLKTFGVLYLQALNPLVMNVEYWDQRFWAYLFDLNFGILPFYPILLPIFIIALFIGMLSKKISAYFYFIAFFGNMFLFSRIYHINCGMTGIARYNAWLLPIMIFYLCIELPRIIAQVKLRQVWNQLLGFILICSAVFSGAYSLRWMKYNSAIYVHFSPIARLVMSYVPQAYDPYIYTFISRSQHVDGGYFTPDKPLFFADKSGYVRKILIPPNLDKEYVLGFFSGEADDILQLERKIDSIANPSQFNYLNTPDLEIFYSEAKLIKLIQSSYESLGTVLMAKDIVLDSGGYIFAYNIPAQISPQSLYKISFSSRSEAVPEILYVDIVGENYDNGPQEQLFDFAPGKHEYVAVLDAGENPPRDVNFRLVVKSTEKIYVDYFMVEEVVKK